jgi:hypothetical protein
MNPFKLSWVSNHNKKLWNRVIQDPRNSSSLFPKTPLFILPKHNHYHKHIFSFICFWILYKCHHKSFSSYHCETGPHFMLHSVPWQKYTIYIYPFHCWWEFLFLNMVIMNETYNHSRTWWSALYSLCLRT